MQIMIVAPCLLPQSPVVRGTTPPQLAMHLAACTPVRHRVRILDLPDAALSCTEGADLYVLLWSAECSPLLLDMAMQLATCETVVCVWDGPPPAPVDYLLEFFDYVIDTAPCTHWQQLVTMIETAQKQYA